MESRKVLLYIRAMEVKSIKIPTNVHRELKVFTAQNDEGMIEFAGYAIMKELKERGHKFILQKKSNQVKG